MFASNDFYFDKEWDSLCILITHIPKRKLYSLFSIYGRASETRKTNYISNLVLFFQFTLWNSESSVDMNPVFKISLLLISIVDYLAQNSCKGTVKFYFWLILVSWSLVHFSKDKRLHRINVDQRFHQFMVWILKNIFSQRLVHFILILWRNF